jgi:hypothetical protein
MAARREDVYRLLTQAETKLVGASVRALKAELFDVLHEFFNVTSCWREDIPITIKQNVQSYQVTPSQGGAIIRLFGVIDQNWIPQPAVLMDPSNPGPPGGSSLGPISTNIQPNPTSVLGTRYILLRNQYTAPLNPATAGGNTFTVSVIKNVVSYEVSKDMVPLIPEWIIPTFYEYLLDGLLGHMMNQPNKSYSNDTKGVYHLRRFRDGMAMARIAAIRANTTGAQNWTFPQSFRTRNQKGGISVGAETGWGF